MIANNPRDPIDAVSIAVVDDDARVADTIALHLRELSTALQVFYDPTDCLAALERSPVDILVTDVDMPGMSGVALMERVKALSPATDIVVVTGQADTQVAIETLRLGAFDFFEKPVEPSLLVETVKRTARYQSACRERDRYAEQVMMLSGKQAERWGINAFVGQSEPLKAVVARITKLQRADQVPVLIEGESGTGKELVARAIHYGGRRGAAPFVPVNCSAIPAELVESALFGHVKGAFTGAVADRKGAFMRAHTGTLFLDEIGDMPGAMQAKLLRVLEDGVVTPVGSTKGEKIDVRVVAATNVHILERIKEGGFREDLYYRVAGYSIVVPPLRERPGDIPLLVRHFTETLSAEMGIAPPSIAASAMAALEQHRFAGNIRELRNVVQAALVECDGVEIERAHLRFAQPALETSAAEADATPASVPGPTTLNLAMLEQSAVREAIRQAGGNMSKAARLLGINRPKLYRKVAQFELSEAM